VDPADIEECPICGAVAWDERPLPFHRALKTWLWRTALDPLSWPRSEAVCGQCGHQEPRGIPSWAVLAATKPVGWWGLPHLLLRALIRRRKVHSPRFFYVGAAAVGGAVGAAVDLAFGLPWWTFAVGAPIALWLWVTLPAMRPSAGTRTLWNEALEKIHPRSAWDAQRQRFYRVLRSPPFPLYGLPSGWAGPRLAGGHGEGSEGVTSISLGHGDPFDPSAPQAHVEVARERHPLPLEYRLRTEAENIWHQEEAPPPPGLNDDQFRSWVEEREREFRERPLPEPRTIALSIDGSRTDAQFIAEGSSWVAFAELDDLTVTVRARNIPVEDVELVRVTDVEPYIEGSRHLDDKSWREDDT
jgi:hypothetical protein